MRIIKTYVDDTMVMELDVEGGLVSFTPEGICVENEDGRVLLKGMWNERVLALLAQGIESLRDIHRSRRMQEWEKEGVR